MATRFAGLRVELEAANTQSYIRRAESRKRAYAAGCEQVLLVNPGFFTQFAGASTTTRVLRYSTRVRKGLEASRRVDNSQVVQKRIDLDL